MAIKCHSSFVHYNMFHNHHCHGGGNNYGSIFNIQHNCGGGTNFWGGLGAGIGYGLGGMFSGLFGGFGNMFGGFGNMFGMGNMFGGFGGFGLGGFGGFASSLGTYFGYELAEGLDGLFSRKDKDRTKINKKDKDDDVKKDDDANKDVKPEDDKAYENINKLHEKANSFLNKNVTEINLKELASLLIEIENYKLADEFKSTENNEQLNNIKTQLLNIQKQAQEAGKEGEDDASLVQAVNDLEGYKKLSDEQKGQVTKGQAISIIKDFEQNEAGEYIISEIDTDKLELLGKAGVKVQFGRNDGDDVTQKHIHGNFEIKLDEQGKLESFTIDNSVYSEEMGLKWTFVPNKDNSACTIKNIKNTSNKTIYVAPDYFTRLYQIEEGVMVINDTPTVSSFRRALAQNDNDDKVKNSEGTEIRQYIEVKPGETIEDALARLGYKFQ